MKSSRMPLVIAAFTLANIAHIDAQDYDLQWSNLSAGVHQARSDNYSLAGALGTVEAPTLSSEQYTLQPGYPDLPVAEQLPDGPRLSIARTERGIRISWPVDARSYILESSDQLGDKAVWSQPRLGYDFDATEFFVIVPPEKAARCYRLRLP